MAEEEKAVDAAKGGANVLTKKIGPLPLFVWLAAAGLIYYYFAKKSGGSSPTAAAQTDPAGNSGQINPSTGYVYGSPEDQAAQGSNNGLGTGSSSTSGSTTAGQYADNTAWAAAAINYLVSIGVDPTGANSAIEQFLSSQALTVNQQADVNLAIQRIGAPPDPPQPGTSPPPIVTPPSPGSTTASNPPSGLTTTSVSTSSVGLKWNSVTNAKSYTVGHGTTSAASDGSTTVSSPTTSTTVSGLKPGTLYYFRVQAQPAKAGAPFASTSKTTAKSSTPSSGGSTGSTSGSAPKAVTVKRGDSFSSIASANGYKAGGHSLWVYNYTSSPHTAEAKATIKQRGPDLVVAGETVYVPKG